MSDDELIKAIQAAELQLTGNLVNADTDLAFKITAYEAEYESRRLNEPSIEKMHIFIINNYGPCFGIPEGQCTE